VADAELAGFLYACRQKFFIDCLMHVTGQIKKEAALQRSSLSCNSLFVVVAIVVMVFPLFAMVAMGISGFIGLPVRVILPFVVFPFVVLTIFPALLVIFIAVITAFIAIMMILDLFIVMVTILRDDRCSSETADCHDERHRSRFNLHSSSV
jgi:hypothetical protein